MLLVTAYCTFIFWMSSGPVTVPETIQFDGVDKVAHFCLYGGLGGLVYFGLWQSGRLWSRRALFCIPVLFVAFYGASDEFHQYFVPTRSTEFLDWVADGSGGLVAATLSPVFFRFLGKFLPETLVRAGE